MRNESIDTEFIILENIYDSSEQEAPLRQRDLAHIAGTSLGMTNVILKRLARKGWISVKKLNSRNIQYAITLDGINEIVRRSYRYFKRTIRNVVFFKDRIDEAVYGAKKKNLRSVLLIGVSDLEFILEHFCQIHGMRFLTAPDAEAAALLLEENPFLGENALAVYSENIPITEIRAGRNVLSLSRMVMEKSVENPGDPAPGVRP
jgi:DNA-binding MarR family transcriptional regulator